jgi:hypothetical protein
LRVKKDFFFYRYTASCEAASGTERQTYFQQMLDILTSREQMEASSSNSKNKEEEEMIICSTGSDVISFISAVQVGL